MTVPRTRRPGRRTVGAAVLLTAALAGACGDDEAGGDLASFCAAVADLRGADPFAELQVASPADMRDAFATLAEAAERIEDDAPSDVRVHAERYAEAIEVLRDELAGSAYDPTRVDNLRYTRAVAEYSEAATSVDNAADARC